MPVLPSSLIAITSLLRGCFTAASFQTFEALLHGFFAHIGEKTVCGMWQGARLAGKLHHSRAHDFFARARWRPEELGVALLGFLAERFLDEDAPLQIAVDGSVFGRSGKKVHGASWHHDSSAAPGGGFKFGTCFVVLGLVVRIPALGERAWCLPVLFRLWSPTPKPTKRNPKPARRRSQQDLAAVLVAKLAERFPARKVDVVGDVAFGCEAMAPPAESVTMTTRLRSNAVIHAPKPPPTGRRGRPRVKGKRLGAATQVRIAAAAKASAWKPIEVAGREIDALVVKGLWYSVFGSRPVQVVIVREPGEAEGYEIALISTDVSASPAEIVSRYGDRWSIEVAFQDAKHVSGVGEARNRVRLAVERTVPFLLCQTVAVAWYALIADPAADVERRRRVAPWYWQKRDPSMLDVLAALRRELIRAEYLAGAGRRRRSQQIAAAQARSLRAVA